MGDENVQDEGGQDTRTVNMTQAEFDRMMGERLKAHEEDVRKKAEVELVQKYQSDIELGNTLRQYGQDSSQILQSWKAEQEKAQAQQAGVAPEMWSRMTAQERRIAELEKENQAAKLAMQESAVAGRPGYQEYRGQVLQLANQSGITVEQAYRAVVPPEVQFPNQTKSEQDALRQILNKDSKGLPKGEGSSAQPKPTFRDLDDKDFDAVQKAVLSGKRVTSLP